jgi:hypothetical protein
MTRLEAIKLRIAANRSTMNGDEFLKLLDDFAKAAVEASIPHVVPMRTRDDALAAHAARTGTVKLTDEQVDSVIEEIKRSGPNNAPIVPVPDPPTFGLARVQGPEGSTVAATRDITDADKKIIRDRYKNARGGKFRVERGWIRRVAEEYHVDPTKIYNIIYTDPTYEGIPRTT